MKKVIGLLGVFLVALLSLVSCGVNNQQTTTDGSINLAKRVAAQNGIEEDCIKFGKWQRQSGTTIILDANYWDTGVSIMPLYPYKKLDNNKIEVDSLDKNSVKKGTFIMEFSKDENNNYICYMTSCTYLYPEEYTEVVETIKPESIFYYQVEAK